MRGATIVEVMVVVALVALAVIGGFTLFSGTLSAQTLDFGKKVKNLDGNTPGATPGAAASSKSFQTTGSPNDKNGPTCDAIRGCTASSTPTPAATPIDKPRIDGLVRDLLLRPNAERGAALAALSASDFAAVESRLHALEGAMIALKAANDPSAAAFAAASERYTHSQEGILPSLFNSGEIDASKTAREQALLAFMTKAAARVDSGVKDAAGSPNGLGIEFYELENRLQVAPAFMSQEGDGGFALPGLVNLSAAEHARTWEIQRARDAEAKQIRAFAVFSATQGFATLRAIGQSERDFLSSIREKLPPSVRAEFTKFFTARTVVVNGKAEVRLVPTDELRRLQDAQAALLGVDVNGYEMKRTLPFNAPVTGDEAFRWWLTYGTVDPRALAKQWNPAPGDGIETADEVFALLPIGTAVTVARGLGAFAIREIAGMAAKEVVVNAVVLGTSEAVADRYGPLAGTGVGVATVLAAIVTHRLVVNPRVATAAEGFVKTEPPRLGDPRPALDQTFGLGGDAAKLESVRGKTVLLSDGRTLIGPEAKVSGQISNLTSDRVLALEPSPTGPYTVSVHSTADSLSFYADYEALQPLSPRSVAVKMWKDGYRGGDIRLVACECAQNTSLIKSLRGELTKSVSLDRPVGTITAPTVPVTGNGDLTGPGKWVSFPPP